MTSEFEILKTEISTLVHNKPNEAHRALQAWVEILGEILALFPPLHIEKVARKDIDPAIREGSSPFSEYQGRGPTFFLKLFEPNANLDFAYVGPAPIAYFRLDEKTWHAVSITSYIERDLKSIAEHLTKSWRDEGNHGAGEASFPAWARTPNSKGSPLMLFDLSEADWESDEAIQKMAENIWDIFAAANPKSVQDAKASKSRKLEGK